EMGLNDQAAINSATGQIGFLQQLTNDKLVLQAAIKRLMPRSRSAIDSERPPMTEYQALAIERYDKDVTDFFVDQVLKDMLGTSLEIAKNIVAARASTILQQAANITTSSLSTFESLLRSSASLAGRKLVLFVSGGFFLDTKKSNEADRMRRITDAAKRTGTVIYSIDARGLSTVGLPD